MNHKYGSVLNHVHDFRIKKGVTQEELARAVGVSRQTIISIEKGNYDPSVCTALKVASFFEAPVEKIFCLPCTGRDT
jgi:putative transcriptional regulator